MRYALGKMTPRQEGGTDMNTGKSVEVELPALGRNGRVVVEGVDISRNVAAVAVESTPSSATEITLTLMGLQVNVAADGIAHLVMPAGVREALEALGWTAPAAPSRVLQEVPGAGPTGPVLLTLDELGHSMRDPRDPAGLPHVVDLAPYDSCDA